MYVLGLNAYHGDSSAALVKNGVIVAAAEEERFARVKHWAGLPMCSIKYCLGQQGIGYSELDAVAINTDNNAHRWKKLQYVMKAKPSLGLLLDKLSLRQSRSNILDEIGLHTDEDMRDLNLVKVEHHFAHLASAYYPSSFNRSALLSVDGFGDFSSTVWGQGDSGEIEIQGYRQFPHSLGIFYQAITQYLGFPNYGDEYKVMGLASFGKPLYLKKLQELLKACKPGFFQLEMKYFRHHQTAVSHRWNGGSPEFDVLYSAELEELLGPSRSKNDKITERHKDIAASAQALYENIFIDILNFLHSKTGSNNLALAGGCAMNSVANGKIKTNTPFQNIYVQPAAGDAGGAIGAALVAYHNLSSDNVTGVMANPYLGPEFSNKEISELIKNTDLPEQEFEVKKHDNNGLTDFVARKIDAGAVVGWFQGRMEWGSRSLGNRSILADPRRADIQELLNAKIKRRESFRPFAPSILKQCVGDWFEIVDDVPFMEKVYPIIPSKQKLIPAVTHVDGTGRLQTVTEEQNPLYYALINRFYELTQVPILLNTSFNENEPIVCTPQEALECFLRTNMDVLVMQSYSITRVSL